MADLTAGVRVCFCDLGDRPADDWAAHNDGCLMLDWALYNGKITYAEWSQRFTGALVDLGITDEELDAEAAEVPRYSVLDAVQAMLRAAVTPPPYSPFFGRRRPPPPMPKGCYVCEYGFTVHVRGACRCLR